MSATQITDALPEEDLLGIEPDLLQQDDAGWLQRLSLFTGRTLSDTALKQEQNYRAGRLNLLGQAVTPGTVQGLELSVDLSKDSPTLLMTPGYGLCATGQDVTLLRSMKTTLGSLAVLDGDTGEFLSNFPDFANKQKAPWAGVLALQAVVASVPGSAVDSGSVNVIVSGNLDASCGQDPDEYAFSDPQLVDATQLVLLSWSSKLALPAYNPAATFRNRLAYSVFNAELGLAADDQMPWLWLAVPVALAGFDANSKLLFADRSSVVRLGGLRRRRYVIPGGAAQGFAVAQPALASARVTQFSEQLGTVLTPSSIGGLVASQFDTIPPCGILPAFAMDFPNKLALWPPANWQITAVPVYTQELEGILEAAALAAPLDTTAAETIEILVPLPDGVFDPNVLDVESIDRVFAQEVAAAQLARNVELQHLTVMELEINALAVVLGQQAIVLNDGLTADEISGRDGPTLFTPDADEAFGTIATPITSGATPTPLNATYASADLNTLKSAEAAAPYAITAAGQTLTLVSGEDWNNLNTYGLQYFINAISARVDKANDLLDLGFLTSQTDIYRYRQNVLGSVDATRLAVSPVLANIASGSTSAATAQNISDYLAANKTTAPTSKPPYAPEKESTQTAGTADTRSSADTFSRRALTFAGPVTIPVGTFTTVSPGTFTKVSGGAFNAGTFGNVATASTGIGLASSGATKISNINLATFNPIQVGTTSNPATPVDVTQQSPIVGAQLNLRTITIAERLSPSASQEALFYSIANRWSLMLLLADLELTLDDLPILVDGATQYTVADIKGPNSNGLYAAVNAPYVPTLTLVTDQTPNPDEGGTFATGIHVLEQHTQLLRAVEGRVQLYQNFLSLCQTTLTNTQSNMASATSVLTRLQNDLNLARQNLTFVQCLQNDEEARVATVNATRTRVLQTYVQYVAYARPRTLVNTARTPSRQLLPANVASPVPACLNETSAIPPELREMVALLRESPVSHLPSMGTQLGKLGSPAVLLGLASDMQIRAAVQLQVPLPTSSAATAAGVYSASIASVYTTNQAMVRSYQAQRAAFNPSQLANQSWSTQIGVLQGVVGVADLMASQSVHAEVSNAASRLVQQISSVAACLYTRVGSASPGDRLEWAEFLMNNGSAVSLRSLAVLPGWNSQEYVDRQQMQLLVDWLFQQIDASDPTATALMSDLIAVAILLASNAPVDSILTGAVALRTKPVAGSPIRLTLSSDRVVHGMSVQLYSAGDLAARAVVSDLDSTGVTATVTDVYKPGVALQPSDIAHFTALNRDAVVLKAFAN